MKGTCPRQKGKRKGEGREKGQVATPTHRKSQLSSSEQEYLPEEEYVIDIQ